MPPLRMLIVDDNALFRDAAGAVVRGDPRCELSGVACSGSQAIEAVFDLHPDLVFVDARLGAVSGFDVATAIRLIAPACRVIMMSLHDSPAYRERSREVGAADFIGKSEFGARFPALVAQYATRAAKE